MYSYNLFINSYEFSVLGSKHPKIIFTDYKPIIILFTQKFYPSHREPYISTNSTKISKPTYGLESRQNLVLPDTRSRNTPPELLTPKNNCRNNTKFKIFLGKGKKSPQIEGKSEVKFESD